MNEVKCFVCKKEGWYCKNAQDSRGNKREVIDNGQKSGELVMNRIEECPRLLQVRQRRGRERFYGKLR